jgi:lipopolysaccharide transport system permease protein
MNQSPSSIPHNHIPDLLKLWQLSQQSPWGQLKFAWHSRRVWWFTATARTKARYVRTKLGNLWLGLTNLLSIAALAAVYGTVFKVENFREYAVYLGVGLVLWNSLSGAIGSAPQLFERNRDSINNINLPPLFYALEEWAFQLQTFLQSFAMVLLGLTLLQHSLLLNILVFGLPGILNFAVFLFWLPLLVCLVGARFKDFYQLVPIVLQLVFLLSPILYMKSNLGSMHWITSLNPLYNSFSPLRDSVIHGNPAVHANLIQLISNLIGLYVSLVFLRKERKILPFLV